MVGAEELSAFVVDQVDAFAQPQHTVAPSVPEPQCDPCWPRSSVAHLDAALCASIRVPLQLMRCIGMRPRRSAKAHHSKPNETKAKNKVGCVRACIALCGLGCVCALGGAGREGEGFKGLAALQRSLRYLAVQQVY
jgi:hypothetical protein